MKKAFVLGAGLGTRLRPLTNILPKPLVPVRNRPLIEYAFDHLRGVGVNEFIVNTHHLSDRYPETFPDGQHCGKPITFVDEQPVVLETGGGLANIADLVGDDDFFVYNGDILTDIPLQPLIDAHKQSNNLVTLALRSGGHLSNVAWDRESGQIRDLRNALETHSSDLFQFACIYIVNPEFLSFVRPEPMSVVPAWLRLISEQDKLGGVLVDEADWWDLGDLNSYLDASLFSPAAADGERIHPSAQIDPTADIDDVSSISANCVVGPGAKIRESILWPNAQVDGSAELHRSVATAAAGPVTGAHSGVALA